MMWKTCVAGVLMALVVAVAANDCEEVAKGKGDAYTKCHKCSFETSVGRDCYWISATKKCETRVFGVDNPSTEFRDPEKCLTMYSDFKGCDETLKGVAKTIGSLLVSMPTLALWSVSPTMMNALVALDETADKVYIRKAAYESCRVMNKINAIAIQALSTQTMCDKVEQFKKDIDDASMDLFKGIMAALESVPVFGDAIGVINKAIDIIKGFTDLVEAQDSAINSAWILKMYNNLRELSVKSENMAQSCALLTINIKTDNNDQKLFLGMSDMMSNDDKSAQVMQGIKDLQAAMSKGVCRSLKGVGVLQCTSTDWSSYNGQVADLKILKIIDRLKWAPKFKTCSNWSTISADLTVLVRGWAGEIVRSDRAAGLPDGLFAKLDNAFETCSVEKNRVVQQQAQAKLRALRARVPLRR